MATAPEASNAATYEAFVVKCDEMRQLAMDLQARMTRVVEMARLIERETDDMEADSEASRIRICAEVIWETGDTARDDLESIEAALARAPWAPSQEPAV